MPACLLPPDFDGQPLDAITNYLVSQHPSGAWSGLVSSFNGMAYRIHAAAEADDILTESVQVLQHHTNAQERLKQEVSIFNFFVNSASCIEAFYYGFFMIGSVLKPHKFPAKTSSELRSINPTNTAKAYRSAYTGDQFTIKINDLQRSQEWITIYEYRDMYIHRGSLPRTHDVQLVGRVMDTRNVRRIAIPGNPKDYPGQWVPTMELNAETTRRLRTWLAKELGELLRAGLSFCAAHLPAPPPPVST